MTPTNKLRFVERQIKLPDFYVNPNTMKPLHQTISILQQWWEDSNPLMRGLWKDGHGGEWRDVPVEKEET